MKTPATVALICLAGIAQAAEPKPNMIFILADDLSYWDISHFGQKHFATPNIGRLATEGRVFANAYAGGPWCAPSRTALLTGRNARHFSPLEEDANGRGTKFNPTVAEVLKTAGYSTCALGKWHMSEPGDSWRFLKTWEDQKAATNWKQMPWNRPPAPSGGSGTTGPAMTRRPARRTACCSTKNGLPSVSTTPRTCSTSPPIPA